MVAALGPGKFYGSSLPRPRFYTDVKFNSERVDPPVSVMDPLMSWAQEAHWTMGGLSFTRHRLQGRIEGNIQKLRTEREKSLKKRNPKSPEKDGNEIGFDGFSSPSLPPAPVAVKRRRLVDDEAEEEVEEVECKRRTVRKLKDDFDKVATRQSPVKKAASGSDGVEETVAVVARTRSRRSEEENVGKNVVKTKGRKLVKKSGEKVGPTAAGNVTRTSPRLAKNRSS